MKLTDVASAEIKFDFFKFGFYFRPYGETGWIKLHKCFTLNKAKKMVIEYQITKYLNN
jgi:hypothetical protein